MIETTQLPERFRAVVTDQIDIYKKGRSVQQRNDIPDTSEIPLDDKRHWLRIPDVICVFVDMLGSTRLSASAQDSKTAGAYQLFSDTAVRLFDKFDAAYIDVRGDGVFALFNSNQPYRAFASAVSFKTFVKEEFVERLKSDTGQDLGVHTGQAPRHATFCKTHRSPKRGLGRQTGQHGSEACLTHDRWRTPRFR